MYLGYGFGLDVFQINVIRWRRVERKLTSAAVAAAVRKTNKREEKETARGQGGLDVKGSVERKIKQLARTNRRVFN